MIEQVKTCYVRNFMGYHSCVIKLGRGLIVRHLAIVFQRSVVKGGLGIGFI